MSLSWSREPRPVWDEDKVRVIGGAPPGALDITHPEGEELLGDWFVASEDGRPVGYGWMDSTWGGDTEILCAVDPAEQAHGVGSFVMTHLESEAAQRGMNYVYNTVRESHPDREAVHDWLLVRGYRGNDRDESLRKRVTVGAPTETTPAREPQPRLTAVPPGHEESGGYVDIEDHRY